MRRIALLLGFFGLILFGCPQEPDLRPRVERLTPDLVAMGQERYVTLHGSFAPVASWSAAGQPTLSLDFAVQIGSASCDQVVVAGPDTLVARVPDSLEAGCHDVAVTGPSGESGLLSGGLCVGSVSQLQVIHTCLLGPGYFSLCAFDAAGSGADFAVLIDDLVPSLDVETGFFQADATQRAYAFSPDDRWLAFLRDRLDVNQQTRLRTLVVADLASPGAEVEVAAVVQAVDETGSVVSSALSRPVWSPDSQTLVWVEERQRLMRLVLAGGPPADAPPDLLYRLAETDAAALYYPDVDLSGSWVLLTRGQGDDATGDGDLSMLLVPLAGGPVRRLDTHPDGAPSRDGPGVFLPSGAGVLFLSDRLGLAVPALTLSMETATNLYVIDLPAGAVRPIGDPVGALLMGLPEVSPNGRRALIPGLLNDLSGSGLDMLMADLDGGGMRHAVLDPVPFCYPDLYEECTLASQHGCCGNTYEGFQCCAPEHPLACPSLDSLAAFAPDSKNFVANMVPYLWTCVSWAGRNTWSLDMLAQAPGIPFVFLLFSVWDEAADPPWSVWVYNNYDLIPLAPSFRQVVTLVP